MQVNLANPWLTYDMSADEIQSSHILNDLQKAHIKNQIVLAANARMALEVNTANPNDFWQKEAYLKGQIDILTHLLTLSDAASSEVHTA